MGLPCGPPTRRLLCDWTHCPHKKPSQQGATVLWRVWAPGGGRWRAQAPGFCRCPLLCRDGRVSGVSEETLFLEGNGSSGGSFPGARAAWDTCKHVHVPTYTHAPTYTNTHAYVHMYKYMHAYVFKHTHACAGRGSCPLCPFSLGHAYPAPPWARSLADSLTGSGCWAVAVSGPLLCSPSLCVCPSPGPRGLRGVFTARFASASPRHTLPTRFLSCLWLLSIFRVKFKSPPQIPEKTTH